ncbi:lysylphosphatidylglycerol synthase domain-containing protein [Haliscomenobacter sp.]|uniref:lysylphosphatidylglycerol synthase domain-containing protein n=1 Tax=Haliscomenobacter sp. TaxID=2717303 RepID=UPI003593B4F0
MFKCIKTTPLRWVLFRYLLAFAIVWGLYTELFRHNNIAELWVLFRHNLSGAALVYLLFCCFLMPFNWLLETFKWRVFTQPWSGMSFKQSWHAVLAGVSASMLLPNRSGDYLGRWLLTPKGQKTQILLATIASNYCQFLVLLGMGFPSLLWLRYYVKSSPIEQTGLFLSFIIVLFLCLLLLGVVVIPWLLHHYAERIRGGTWRGFFKFVQMPLKQGLDITERYSWRTFAAGFGFAWLRYGLYSIQYYAILRFYGINLPLDAALAGVGSIYLLQTAIPLPPVLALLARGEIALLIWGIWGANALSILAASYTLFVLNLAFPALLGLFYIVKKW